MPISDARLDEVVQEWGQYAAERPREIDPRNLLDKRDLNMYVGLGINTAQQFAEALVEHRSTATMEMSMGYLSERLLEELGPTKVTQEEKRRPGYRGVDFLHRRPAELEIVNLKAGLTTFNGDITRATRDNLTAARDYWANQPEADDNPLGRRRRIVTMVRAVARGNRRRAETPQGILWLVGDAMWAHFGAGERFLQRINAGLQRNPLNFERYQEERRGAVRRVVEYLRQGGLIRPDGQPDWNALVARYP